MTTLFTLIVAALFIAQVAIPKRWIFLPILVAAFHLNNYEVLPELTACRLLTLVGLVRLFLLGSFRTIRINILDKAFIGFAAVALLVSIAPRLDVPSPLKQNLGLIINVVLTYLYARLSIDSTHDSLHRLSVAIVCCLIPLAVALTVEKRTGRNLYSILGTVSAEAAEREGKIRATGPFKHPILAGTAGATSLPLVLIIYRRRMMVALLGLLSSLLVVLASSSSGPLAALFAALVGLSLWPWRNSVKLMKWSAIIVVIILHLFSTRGIWYLMARMDLVGGSTGFHRALLIDNAFSDFSRWWLRGTDYTRSWMFSGVSWSDRHTDITNYYIHLGVIGGVGLMGTLILVIIFAFNIIGRLLANLRGMEQTCSLQTFTFAVWCLGCALLAHTISFVSVSYFDQLYVLFYILVGTISSLSSVDWQNGFLQDPNPITEAQASNDLHTELRS